MDDDTRNLGELAEPQGYAHGHDHGGASNAEPDVLLDVPQLRVDEITLDVEDLRAHVSVQANVLNLLRLSVGADVQLGGVHLEIKGVEAQALLKVRLDKIAEIINRVLTTIDRNPEIIDRIVPPLPTAAGELESAAGRTVERLPEAVGSAADLGRSAAETIGDTGVSDVSPAGQAVAAAPQGEAAPGGEAGSAGADEGTPRGLLRRRKQQPNLEEPPP